MSAPKPPLRLISIAWGESYVDTFLELCLPALLAPGNLPVLGAHYAVELVFVTETRFFEKVHAHPSFRLATSFCTPRVVSLDDLVTTRTSYGMALTYSFFRGFQDLGADMTNCQLVFIHADFILADGSYRNLLPYLLRGDRLVFSPSYCAIAEDVQPTLLQAREQDGTVLSIPHRSMADLTIRNRHYTVRAKTVNQRFFCLKHTEQFYWIADEFTLLARQLPIALVAMKPERYLEDMHALWDYGVIAEFCPSMKYTVLGDSDEYLMMELRDRDTAKLDLALGWPTAKQIAHGLGTFITDYKKKLGRERLTLHSRDLPPHVEQAHTELDRYVDDVYAKLPATLLPTLNHPQWTYHLPLFRASRDEQLKSSGQALQESAGDLERLSLTSPIEQIREKLLTISKGMRDNPLPGTPSIAAVALRKNIQATVENIDQILALESERAKFMNEAIHVFDLLRRVRPVNETAGMPQPSRDDAARNELSQRMVRLRDLSASVATSCGTAERFAEEILWENVISFRSAAETMASTAEQMTEASRNAETQMNGQRHLGGLARRVSRAIFGASPYYRSWHWLHSSSRLGIAAARTAGSGRRRVLLLQGSTQLLNFLHESDIVTTAPVAAAYLPSLLRLMVENLAEFDVCIIESEMSDLGRLRAIHDEIRPLLRPGAKIVAMFLNIRLLSIPRDDPYFIRNAFPVCGPARIAYSGSWASILATRLRMQVAKRLTRRQGLSETMSVAVAMALAAPFALLGTILESRRTMTNSWNPPTQVTAVTVEIQIG